MLPELRLYSYSSPATSRY